MRGSRVIGCRGGRIGIGVRVIMYGRHEDIYLSVAYGTIRLNGAVFFLHRFILSQVSIHVAATLIRP